MELRVARKYFFEAYILEGVAVKALGALEVVETELAGSC